MTTFVNEEDLVEVMANGEDFQETQWDLIVDSLIPIE